MATLAEILIGLGAGVILIASAIAISLSWNSVWQKIFPAVNLNAHDSFESNDSRSEGDHTGYHHGSHGGH
ncbi:hypothetical protein [Rhizobium sp. 768_B6_N1_8]|jgi:hypothetical protein|uniref:hypothetical protein n=1 Tax=unclassified Rhizobium TaxID=2613769 RepID=UPI003F228F96